MCGFMMTTGNEEGTVATKTKSDAKAALENIEKAERDVDTTVRDFKQKNKKYLIGKKRKATTQAVDGQARNAAQGVNSNWYLQMAAKMEPEGTLKNNSGLTEMRAWQKQL